MSQTSYSLRLTEALAGMLAAPVEDCTIESYSNAAALPAGVFVTRDAADSACKVPTSSAEVTASGIGFVMRNLAQEPVSDGGSTDVAALKGASVVTRGKIWVLTESACAFGGDVFVRFTVEAPDLQLGMPRNDADTDKAVAAPGWKFRTTLGAAGLAIVER